MTWPKAKVCLRLVDEQGAVLTQTKGGVGFMLPEKSWATYKPQAIKGLTNGKGEFWAEGRTMNSLGVGSQPEGFYLSHRSIYLNDVKRGDRPDSDSMWMPFPRRETLILKRILNPAPMYVVGNLEIELPGVGTTGFDLAKRDWVAPHGIGLHGHLIITLEKLEKLGQRPRATLKITFSNPGDGIIPLYELKGAESELRLPREAPANGYQTELVFRAEWDVAHDPQPAEKPALGYIYRVGTVLDEKGHVKSSWYGKIDGEFEWDPKYSKTAKVKLSYYLNPDGTRNLEFDSTKNLFKDLPIQNAVQRP